MLYLCPKMKVLFDHQIFEFPFGGASKYFVELLSNLPKDSWACTSLLSCNEYAREKHLFPHMCRKHFKGQLRVMDYINRPYTNILLRYADYDIFHQTNLGTYCMKSVRNKPFVTTYHDSNLSTFDPHPEIVSRQSVSLQRADAIITVSNNTKADLLHYFPFVDSEKVHVIYHGIEMPDNIHVSSERVFPFPYFLFVGRRSEYKNFDRLLTSFLRFRKTFKDVHLVCTSEPFSNKEKTFFVSNGIAQYVHHISASEERMQRLYRDAIFFIYPSLYEGFGMPILEAWANHCPVALSKASCFPEICQEAGEYFDPLDIDSMVAAMTKLTEDDKRREELIFLGDKRVRLFSWERCAQEHMKVYESLL